MACKRKMKQIPEKASLYNILCTREYICNSACMYTVRPVSNVALLSNALTKKDNEGFS